MLTAAVSVFRPLCSDIIWPIICGSSCTDLRIFSDQKEYTSTARRAHHIDDGMAFAAWERRIGGRIHFPINGLSTESHLRSQRTPKPYKIIVNNCKLIDFVIRIQLTRAILMLRFSNFLRNSCIHFRMFLYLEIYFPRVTVSLLCRLQDVSYRYMFQCIPI